MIQKIMDNDKTGKVSKIVPSSVIDKLKKKEVILTAEKSEIREQLKESLKQIVREPSISSSSQPSKR